MRDISRALGAALLALGLQASAAAATQITFADAEFADVDWSATKVQDTTAGAGATFSAGQVASGGNPDAYRSVTHVYDTGTIRVAHSFEAATYDPTILGAIDTVDFAYDGIHLQPPAGQAVALGPLLVQGDSFYVGPSDAIFDETWTFFDRIGLTAADFARIAGTGAANPDFSATGAPIKAGYFSANTNTSTGSIMRMAGVDNWSVTFNTVPEPGAGLLLSTGLLALGWRRSQRSAP